MVVSSIHPPVAHRTDTTDTGENGVRARAATSLLTDYGYSGHGAGAQACVQLRGNRNVCLLVWFCSLSVALLSVCLSVCLSVWIWLGTVALVCTIFVCSIYLWNVSVRLLASSTSLAVLRSTELVGLGPFDILPPSAVSHHRSHIYKVTYTLQHIVHHTHPYAYPRGVLTTPA